MKLLMEELNNEVSNVEQQVCWSVEIRTVHFTTIRYDTDRATRTTIQYTACPSQSGRANFLYISLQNRTLAQLEERPAFPAHPSSRANFSPYKHFGSPGRVNSVKARQ